MKCSAGVATVAVILLLGSAFMIALSGMGLWVFLGPMGGQFLDPATLPPGADVRMMRAIALGGAVMTGLVGVIGLATGIGLLRLWRWSRYVVLVMAGITIFMSFAGAAGILLFTPPPGSTATPPADMPMWFRAAMAAFYALWGVGGAFCIYFFARAKTVAQFNGEPVEQPLRARPLSVTVIAWLMIVGSILLLPSIFWPKLPAMFLGVVLTGSAARAFYVVFSLAQLGIGVGLLKRTSSSLSPAIVYHGLAVSSALISVIPWVAARYNAALAESTTRLGSASGPGRFGQIFGLVFSVAYAGVILYFLLKAKRGAIANAG
ncbi:MAG: hypothetical protein EPO35_04655 [Acidobacteria bacterium]|nr:MAG: hypothetical protein EPO35_04655 [Acidobacteriota bacterium]